MSKMSKELFAEIEAVIFENTNSLLAHGCGSVRLYVGDIAVICTLVPGICKFEVELRNCGLEYRGLDLSVRELAYGFSYYDLEAWASREVGYSNAFPLAVKEAMYFVIRQLQEDLGLRRAPTLISAASKLSVRQGATRS